MRRDCGVRSHPLQPRWRRSTSKRARARRSGVDAARLWGPLAPAATALATFDQHAGELDDAAAVLVELPALVRSILGMDGPRTYLILGQNSDELRPTGGFIGSMGT